MRIVNKLLSVITLSTILVACSQDPVEQKLEEYVTKHAEGKDLKYDLTSYSIDTITAQIMVDSLKKQMYLLKEKDLDLEAFKKDRNREFVDFRDADYEEEIMHGSLKDASEWCTEIRVVTEKADSLIAVWDSVSIYSYDLTYLKSWYLRRIFQFYHSDIRNYEHLQQMEQVMALIEKHKDDYTILENYTKKPSDQIVGFIVHHTYTIYNPIAKKRVSIKRDVHYDSEWNYICDETKNSFMDMIMQMAE